jgi:hypothetical protein
MPREMTGTAKLQRPGALFRTHFSQSYIDQEKTQAEA